MQKVVTLNTCCDVACPTFQLPHITAGSFHSHRRQPTTGSFRSLQRLKEREKPSIGWKSLAVHKLVWWHFQVWWASWLQSVFFWHNVGQCMWTGFAVPSGFIFLLFFIAFSAPCYRLNWLYISFLAHVKYLVARIAPAAGSYAALAVWKTLNYASKKSSMRMNYAVNGCSRSKKRELTLSRWIPSLWRKRSRESFH